MNNETAKTEAQLQQLEAVICDGISAYEARNELIVDLVNSGVPMVKITHMLNDVRDRNGVSRITGGAITKVYKRNGRDKK